MYGLSVARRLSEAQRPVMIAGEGTRGEPLALTSDTAALVDAVTDPDLISPAVRLSELAGSPEREE
jgi:hypothetical protein